MGKRGADRQLTKDDAEDEDDNGSAATAAAASNSTRAAPDVLARRKIIHLARSKDGKIDLTQKPTVVNPFAHVNLVAPAVPAAAAGIDSAASSAAPTVPSDAAPTVLSDAAPTTSTDAATTASAHKKVKTIAATDKEDEAATAAAGNDATDNTTAAPTVDSTAKTNTTAVDDSDATTKPPAASFGGFGSTGFKGFAEAGGISSGFGAAASGFSFGGGGAASSVFGQGAAAPAFQFAAVPVAGVVDASGGGAKNDDDSAAGDAAPPAAPVANLPKTYEVPSGEEHETVLMTVRCVSKRWGPSSSAAAGAATTDGSKKAAVLAVPPSAQLQNVTKVASSSDETEQGTENGKPGNDTKAASDAKTSGSAAAATSTSEFQWLDIGTGPLKLLQDNDDASKLRLVQRREQTHRGPATTVILNLVLYQETTTQHVAEKMVKIILPAAVRATLSSDKLTSQTYLFKFSEASDATDFYTRVLAECTAHAKPFFDSSRSGTGSNDE